MPPATTPRRRRPPAGSRRRPRGAGPPRQPAAARRGGRGAGAAAARPAPAHRPPPEDPHAEGRRRSLLPFALLAAAALLVGVVIAAASGGDDPSSSGGDRARTQAEGSRTQQTAPEQPVGGAGPSEQPAEQPAEQPPASGASPSELDAQGFDLIGRERYAEAVPILQQAVQGFRDAGDTRSQDYAFALFNLGTALNRSGRPEAAIPLLEERLASATTAARSSRPSSTPRGRRPAVPARAIRGMPARAAATATANGNGNGKDGD